MEHLDYMKILKTLSGKLGTMAETKKSKLENTILSLACFLLLRNHLYVIMYVHMHTSEDNFVELLLFFHLYNGSRN